MSDLVFDAKNTRLVVRQLLDSCVTSMITNYSTQLDNLDMDAQLFVNEKVCGWRQEMEDRLCDHLQTNDTVTPEDIRKLVEQIKISS